MISEHGNISFTDILHLTDIAVEETLLECLLSVHNGIWVIGAVWRCNWWGKVGCRHVVHICKKMYIIWITIVFTFINFSSHVYPNYNNNNPNDSS